MGFTFEEFPNSDYYNSDLREILRYIRKITDYLKSLDAVIEELKEGLARLDAIEANVEMLIAEYGDLSTKLSALIDEVLIIEGHLTSLDTSIEQIQAEVSVLEVRLDGVYQYIDDKYAQLEAQYREDFSILLNKINQIKVNLESEIEELRRRVNEIDTSVYNSWMAKVVGPQENQDFTYNHLADECLTAEQYLTLGLSASEYATLDISSRDYQEFGKTKTHFNWVWSPVYGCKQTVHNVIDSVVNFLCGTLTATAYAGLDLSADDYSALDLTAEEYLKYPTGTGYVTVTPDGTGLTSEQYSHLSIE